jgi:hypothetical protein
MEKRKHYWNGRWGRLARHDVLMFEDGGRWLVESRIGGTEGRSTWAEFEDPDPALDHTRDLLIGDAHWREL